MGAVIKFPRGRRLRGTPATTPDFSAVVIILPVVRIERAPDTPASGKARTAKSVTGKSIATKSVANKSIAAKPVIRSAAKSVSPARKRRKRAASELPSPACTGG
jgi:hypothetical protein